MFGIMVEQRAQRAPGDRKIDGADISGLLLGEEETSPHREFLYYNKMGPLDGIRQGKWKFLRVYPDKRGVRELDFEAEPKTYLFDLEADPGEENNLVAEHPELVEKLIARMEELDREIGENARPVWSQE
jgi:arylsulfatase A